MTSFKPGTAPPQPKSESCECCYYDTAELTLSCESGSNIPRVWLCELCRGSLAGNTAIYKTVHNGELRMIAGFVMNAANHILAELRKGKNQQ